MSTQVSYARVVEFEPQSRNSREGCWLPVESHKLSHAGSIPALASQLKTKKKGDFMVKLYVLFNAEKKETMIPALFQAEETEITPLIGKYPKEVFIHPVTISDGILAYSETGEVIDEYTSLNVDEDQFNMLD